MKKIILSVCMLMLSVNSLASLNTLKVDLDRTTGFKEITTRLPLELSSHQNVKIISNYDNISEKYYMTDKQKKIFIINHPNKNAESTFVVKYNSGRVTKLKVNFVSDNNSCTFSLTTKTTTC